MSYILDALRKADAERDRGSVPGLHAQTSPASADDASPRRTIPPWMWAGAGGALVLIAAMAWQLLGREAETPRERVAAAPAVPIAPTAAAPAAPTEPPAAAAPLPLPVAPPPAPLQAPAPLLAPAPAAAPVRSDRAPLAARQTVAAPSPAPREMAPARRQPEPPVQSAAAAAPAPAPVASAAAADIDSRVYALNELPADVRRELPALNVGGSIYSDNAASRFLIINGQIFHENDKVMPNLTLEQIKLKAAVLKYKGYRYTIGF